MNSITRLTTIGIPTILGISIAWFFNQVIASEKELKNRERDLKLQLETKSRKNI